MNKLRDDSALRSAFSSLQSNALLVIEDIDVAFHMGREMNTKFKPMVTFACLLNCLDGVYYKEGLLTVMTTNHVEKLDPALIRPGRMDLKVNIPNPSRTEVEIYMSKFYKQEVTLDGYDKVIPMAAVQGVCITHKHNAEGAIHAIRNFDDAQIVATYLATPAEGVETDIDLDDEREMMEDDEDGKEPGNEAILEALNTLIAQKA